MATKYTAKQIAASRKRWKKLVAQSKKATAPLIKKLDAVSNRYDLKVERLRKQKSSAIDKLWTAIERKRAPYVKRIQKEIAFRRS